MKKRTIIALIVAPSVMAGAVLPVDTPMLPIPNSIDTLGGAPDEFLLTLIEETPSLQSTLTALVWFDPADNPWDGITFSYTLDASIFQQDELSRLTVTGFEGFDVEVEQSAPAPGEAWSFASRSSSGDVVGAWIHLSGGSLSQRLVVHTSATDWSRVPGAAINGRSVNLTTLGPFDPEDPVVPEPRQWAVLAGLGLFGFAAYRKKKGCKRFGGAGKAS